MAAGRCCSTSGGGGRWRLPSSFFQKEKIALCLRAIAMATVASHMRARVHERAESSQEDERL